MRAAVGVGIAGIAVVGLGIAIGCNAIIGLKPGVGLCAGVMCQAIDECHMAGECDPNTGGCSNPAADTGTSCDDGNACTKTSTCQGGMCMGQDPVDCSVIDPCHPGACDPKDGCAKNSAATDGTPCDDGNLCTRTDTCHGGTCKGQDPVDCSVTNVCHSGACDPKIGCVPVPEETACNDGNVCTTNDTCQAGSCNPDSDHTWAHWDLNSPPPSPRYVFNDDVVFDKLTSLLWQRKATDQSYDWKSAKDFCAALKTIPGYPSGWRLPTRIELASIVDYSRFNPAIDTTAFLGAMLSFDPDAFWSSSPALPALTKEAWTVYFGAGDVLKEQIGDQHRVRCVR